MKISNVKVDLLNWPTDPWQVGSGMFFGGKKQLGIVTVETDEGVSGHAFLSRPEHQASSLIEFLKPKVMGRNPQDIGAIWWDLWKMNRAVSTYAIGAIDVCFVGYQRQDRGPADPSAPGDLQGIRAGLFQLRLS